ncbi:MAG: ATP-dependent DNA helicase RecG [Alphaproteobacteria bacterium]|nr:ATP-dependent DNA helicase RecG [Alphaproteobacteria bacterium]
MRPEILFPLFAPIGALTGVGPHNAKLIEQAAGPRVVDLLWHRPSGLIDRRYAPPVAEAKPGSIATLTITVDTHLPPRIPRLPYKIYAHDASGQLALVFFHARADYLLKTLPVGATRIVSGRIEMFQGLPQITHPDAIGTPEEIESIRTVAPVYPLSAGLSLKVITKAIRLALARTRALPEWQDPALVARHTWPSWHQALLALHAPQSEADLAPTTPARRRLAYDELLASQLAVGLVREHLRQRPGRPTRGDGSLRARVLAALPFNLTASQEQAIDEIERDLASPNRMLRLLQGDVGSGKTVVAFLAMLIAAEAGGQAALMAPTELLARQHYATIAPLAAAAGIEVVLLTGRDKGREREASRAALAEGRIALAVGTHALVQEEVGFADLRLAVIDEQHRFGVHQRMLMTAKGQAVDLLVMTATPIPRTLMLAAYGDLDGSRLTEKPAGRKPVDTRALPIERLDEVIAAVARAIDSGAKVYWVCPLVEESEELDLEAATARHRSLTERFGARVGLVHGGLKPLEKDRVMASFSNGGIDILVATTVIEVGVDVPAATVMVIEHAERFGLAQLHQLRGRVGRSSRASTCLLLYAPPLTQGARARINILRETDDGFRIAEEDLRLRGAGEVLGTRQSGLPMFRLADLGLHSDLLEIARDDARLALERDPTLTGARGAALRVLLYLFERDAVVKYARAG